MTYELERNMHFWKKLLSTVKISVTIAMARTFGHYEVSVSDFSVGNTQFNYAVYHWRGRKWAFPVKPLLDIND